MYYRLILTLFLSIVYNQGLPYGKPNYFNFSKSKTIEKLNINAPHSFSTGIFNLINTNQHKGKIIYFLELSLNKEEPVQFKLIDSLFVDGSEIYFIDLNTNGWVGPYTKKSFNQNPLILSGQLNTKNILIEYSIPRDLNPKNPIQSISLPKKFKSSSINVNTNRNRVPNNKILLCGYWPPSNEGVRHFSTNHLLNPSGWEGENWENRGYDIVSYFPYFDIPDCDDCGQGNGDFEVDYQDTSEDWWNIVDSINPIAIITFSRGYIDYSWELEWQYFNYFYWTADFTAPYYPTPAPPDSTIPMNARRFSSLPMDSIVSKIESSGLGLTPYIDYTQGAGAYLSEFMGYHGVWHKAKMDSANLPCVVAGHVHVGGLIDWDIARQAVDITLREVITVVDQYQNLPGDINNDGVISVLDMISIIQHIFSNQNLTTHQLNIADINSDNLIDIFDLILLSNIILDW